MPICKNGKKMDMSIDDLTFEEFKGQVENMVRNKDIEIHTDSELKESLYMFYGQLDYAGAVLAYEDNALLYGD